MDNVNPTVNDLFKQLGLPSSDAAVEDFLSTHGPIDETLKIYEARCWTSSQAALLKQMIDNDGEWSYLVDEMDMLLREGPEE